MKIIVDANVLFAVLIKQGVTAELLFDPQLEFYIPEFIVEEFLKHEDEILRKTHRTKQEFISLMHLLNQRITVLPHLEIVQYLNQAKAICPDPEDVMYFAAALKLKCAIWSNDKPIKEQQNKIMIYTTKELLELLFK